MRVFRIIIKKLEPGNFERWHTNSNCLAATKTRGEQWVV